MWNVRLLGRDGDELVERNVAIRAFRCQGETASCWVERLGDLDIRQMFGRLGLGTNQSSTFDGFYVHPLPEGVPFAFLVSRLQAALDVAGDAFRATGDVARAFALVADELVEVDVAVALFAMVTDLDGLVIVDPPIDPERADRIRRLDPSSG